MPRIAAADVAALRHCVLGVVVLHDVDLDPADDGVRLPSGRVVPWEAMRAAIAPLAPSDPGATARLAGWLRLLRGISWRTADDLSDRARPVGLPIGHELHPGPSWARRGVLGGCLDLGLGFVGLGTDPERVDVAPSSVLDQVADADVQQLWWERADAYLEAMGALAVDRYHRDPAGAVRPMGDCDVVTLLGNPQLRAALVAGDARGLRTAAVPTRRRGWLDLSRSDPAFAVVAAQLAEPDDSAFPRPLLLTADEVVMARPGGRPVHQVLREPAAPDKLVAAAPRLA